MNTADLIQSRLKTEVFEVPKEVPWRKTISELKKQAPRLTCWDGVSLSVQASARHLCLPKDNCGPYTHVEVGFVSGVMGLPKEWETYAYMPLYCQNISDIYARVPLEMVADFVDRHGGLVEHVQPCNL